LKFSIKKTNNILTSYRFSALNSFFKIVTLVIVPILLARLIDPEIFGIVATSAIYIGVAQFFTTFEMGEAIIKKELNNTLSHSVFWFSLVCGLLSYFLILFFSEIIPFISDDFLLKKVIKIFAIALIINSLTTVPLALLKKKLDFFALSISSLIAGIFSSIISIILAINGIGLWALVSFYLLNQSLFLLIIFFKSKYFPKLIFDINKIKKIFFFGANITLTKILSFIERNFAKLVIGQYLGYAQVGFYSIGSMIVLKPMKTVSQFINPVFYSSISQKKNKINKNITSNLLTYIEFSILIFFPVAIILIFFSNSIVNFVLGEKWQEMSSIVFIFSFLLFIRPASKINIEIFKSLLLTRIILKIYSIFTVLFIIAILITVKFGLEEVAISYVILNYFLSLTSMSYIYKKLNLKFSKIFRNIKYLLMGNILLFSYFGIFAWYDLNNLNILEWYFQLLIIIFGIILYLIFQSFFPTSASKYLLKSIFNKRENLKFQ